MVDKELKARAIQRIAIPRNEDLDKRMDADFDLWNNKQVIYDDHPESINVTTNHPRTFADDIYAPLSRAEMQIIIRMVQEEGEDKRDEIAKLERLYQFAFEKADERLAGMIDTIPFRDWIIWLFENRGRAAARILVEKTPSGIVFNFTPYDPRWLQYQAGENGLVWVAYKMFKSKLDLEADYGDALKDNWLKRVVDNMTGRFRNSIPFYDYWEVSDPAKPTEITNAMICQNELVQEPTYHKLPSIPVLIRAVATRPPIVTTEDGDPNIASFGDSIYAPNRAIYSLENKVLSIEATRGNLLAKQPIVNYYGSNGKELHDTTMQPGGVINLPAADNKLDAVPMKEVPVTLLEFSKEVTSMRESAELPHLPIGGQPPSGTLYSMIEQSGDKIFVPQLRALNDFYGDILRMVEAQLIEKKYKVKVKTEAKRQYYEVDVTFTDLKRPHIIKVEFTARAPWRDLDKYQVADMAKRLGLPDEFIWEYLLKLQDPKGLSDMAAMEVAAHSPNLARLKAIEGFMKRGRHAEALALIKELYNEEMQGQELGQPTGQPTGGQPTA